MSDHSRDDAGHEAVAHALLIGAVGVGALTAARLAGVAVDGLDGVLVALQAHLAG
jgi:hypothetical protein